MDRFLDYPADFNQWIIAWAVVIPLVVAAYVLPRGAARTATTVAAGVTALAVIGLGLFRLSGAPWIGLWGHFFVLGIVAGEVAGRMADQRDQPYGRYFALGFLFTVAGVLAAWLVLRGAPVEAIEAEA